MKKIALIFIALIAITTSCTEEQRIDMKLNKIERLMGAEQTESRVEKIDDLLVELCFLPDDSFTDSQLDRLDDLLTRQEKL